VNHAIQDDVRAQVHAFADRVRWTLDPANGPALGESDGFDLRLAELDGEFARLKRMFHDYLVTSWSGDAVRAMRAAAGDAPATPATAPQVAPAPAAPRASVFPDADAKAVVRRMWTNWLLLACSGVVTIAGLVAGTLPLVRAGGLTSWPWRSTETALLVALSVAVAALVAYLTRQQRALSALQAELADVRDAAVARMRRHCDRLRALLDVSRSMGAETDVEAIFDRITMTCMKTFGCEQVSLMTLDASVTPPELLVRSAAGHANLGAVLGSRRKLGEGIAGYAAERREARILGPVAAGSDRGSQPALTASMVVPIEVRGELVGVLNIGTRKTDVVFDEEDLRALQVFAGNAGASIRHAEQTTWMRQTIATLQRNR